MKDTVTSRKYAKALFAQAQADKQLRACQQGLEEIARVVRARDSLRGVLTQPFIGSLEKQKLIRSAMGEYATPLLERFLNLLVKRRRFDLLPMIIQQFQEEVDRSQNMQTVRVRVAYAMTEGQRKSFQAQLEKWLDSKVRMDVAVDPELIGGVVVQFQDRELNLSLRRQLSRMKDALSR
jgi:F-type H+-transporting ATPase subunit delta